MTDSLQQLIQRELQQLNPYKWSDPPDYEDEAKDITHYLRWWHTPQDIDHMVSVVLFEWGNKAWLHGDYAQLAHYIHSLLPSHVKPPA